MRADNGVYLRPETVAEAVRALAASPLTILAGGTDLYAARTAHEIREPVLDVTGIRELRGISEQGAHWRIGATTTWSDIVEGQLPAVFRCLVSAAKEIGGLQVQNAGTIAGNICNASPAADGTPALMALDAQVELASEDGRRLVPVPQFVLGSRKVAIEPGELVTALVVPRRVNGRSSFIKAGHRRYLVISIAMVAVVLDVDDSSIITYARVVVGSCSAAARRLASLESLLVGKRLSRSMLNDIPDEHLSVLSPIDDVRGSAEYRLDAVKTLVKRAYEEAVDEYAD